MKFVGSTLGVLSLMLSANVALGAVKLKSLNEKASYAIGLNIGQNLRQQGAEIEMDQLIEGLRHGIKDQAPLLKPDELQKTMQEYGGKIQQAQMTKRKADGDKNKSAGEKFLADNKKKADIKVLPSGLQYKVITAGNGPKPKATDTVVTHYRGTLIDGSEFDSSYSRGEPATFPVNGVIKGWTEALQLMPKGAKWQLFVPYDLAYGEQGSGPKIGPFATLIFDVELLDIKNEKK